MKTYCEKCGTFRQCDAAHSRIERLEIRGVPLAVEQSFSLCPVCGEELYPTDLVDRNVMAAHNAYRRAVGSITGEEIQAILTLYDIGAQPLSRLLGWGENTIERQMKHTVPDKAHADALRALNDPRNMKALLEKNGAVLSDVARRKAMAAVTEELRKRQRLRRNMVNAYGSRKRSEGVCQMEYNKALPWRYAKGRSA